MIFDAHDVQLLFVTAAERQSSEPEFRARLDDIVDVLISSPIRPDQEMLLAAAVGAAGLALHMDDVRSGRWPK